MGRYTSVCIDTTHGREDGEREDDEKAREEGQEKMAREREREVGVMMRWRKPY